MRYRLRAEAEGFVTDPEQVTTMPEDWGFMYDPTLVVRAYARWRASGYRHLPGADEVLNINEDWERDILLFGRLVQFKEQWKKSNPPQPNGGDSNGRDH